MGLTEFSLIDRYFKRPAVGGALGIGDDCALLQPSPGHRLAVSCDMLVEGRHFLEGVDPYKLGHKALAVSLSDLAAVGAQPVAFLLALSLPRAIPNWLEGFSRGIFSLAQAYGCDLIGGDTTQGPLNVCVTAFGEVPDIEGGAILRSGARVGDDVYVSGSLGDARLALDVLQGRLKVPAPVLLAARAKLELPIPRVALGLALRGLATAAIDLSDGLLGDLGHILTGSAVGATINLDVAVGLIASYACGADWAQAVTVEQWRTMALAGGDDYELLFTAPASRREAVAQASRNSLTPVARVGQIDAEPGVRVVDHEGRMWPSDCYASFEHFA